MRVFLLIFAASLLLTAGCSSARFKNQKQLFVQTATSEKNVLNNIPAFTQRGNNCGPSALASLLSFYGDPISPESLHDGLFIESLDGTLQKDLVATTRKLGFLAHESKMDLAKITSLIDFNQPTLVLFNLGLESIPIWHYAVVSGYDAESNRIQLLFGEDTPKWVKLRTFEKWWHGGGYWGLNALKPNAEPQVLSDFEWKLAISNSLESGNTEVALTALNTYIQDRPHDSSANFMLGNIHFLQGEYSSAVSSYKSALIESQNKAPILVNLSWSYLKQNKVESAQKVFSQIENEAENKDLTSAISTLSAELQKRNL